MRARSRLGQLCSHKLNPISAIASRPKRKTQQMTRNKSRTRGWVWSYLFSSALIFSSFSWTAWLSFLVSDSSSSKVSTLLKILKKLLHFQDVFTIYGTRSRRVVGSNPIWGSDFFRVLQTFNLSCVCCFIFNVFTILKIINERRFGRKKDHRISKTF